MKKIKCPIYTVVFCLVTSAWLFAQQNNTWHAFGNPENNELIGFKDENGMVRIAPKFSEIMEGWKFDDIVAVIELAGSKYESYYLTKSGNIVGRDSLFFFDNMPDCENEGFIRFYDKRTDKVGLFNSNGEIVIPAEYNALTNVRNGLIAGLQNAEKQYWHANDHAGCNHFSWVNGESVLLDTANRVLIENFNYQGTLDYYSVQTSDYIIDDDCRLSFRSTDGVYYSFIHLENEFDSWLKDSLLTDYSEEKLLSASYDRITWAADTWRTEPKHDFVKRNSELLSDRLLLLKQSDCDCFISSGGLNKFIFEAEEFNSYYNNCGDPKEWQYPVMSLILNHRNGDRLAQDHFDFLRTDEGYRLLSVSINSGYLQ